MSTDNYELFKTTEPQQVEGSPFVSRQWNWVGDINQGVYNNSGLCLVQFDLSSIYNSTKLIDLQNAFLAIPITYATVFGNGTTALCPPLPNGSIFSTALKSGYFQLIHALDISLDGKQLESYQPYLNNYVNFKLLSTWNADDILQTGSTYGLGDYGCDSWQSMVYNIGTNTASTGTFPTSVVTAGVGGNGIINNKPFAVPIPLTTSLTTAGGVANSVNITLGAANAAIYVGMSVIGTGIPMYAYVVSINGTALVINEAAVEAAAIVTLYFYSQSSISNSGDQSNYGQQFTGTYNKNLYSRLRKFSDSNGASNFFGGAATNLTNIQNLQKEFKPYFNIVNSTTAVWYDVAIIKMSDIASSMNSLPLSKKLDMTMRCYLNTGTVVSAVANGGLMLSSGGSISFTNTCPLMHCCLDTLPSTCTNIGSALVVGSMPTGMTVNLNATNTNAVFSTNAHFMPQCRFYYSQIEMKSNIMANYISNNRAKQLCYTAFLTNTFQAIGGSSTFSYLVQSGVTRIKSVIVIPYISASINGTFGSTNAGVSPFAQQLSPFDSCPNTSAPISIINFNVSVGGVNVLANNLQSYTFENFIEAINSYGNTALSDRGLGLGLYNQEFWNMNRTYYIDCSRCNLADFETPRNINITGTMNIGNGVSATTQAVDMLVITEYYKLAVIDVETGLVTM